MSHRPFGARRRSRKQLVAIAQAIHAEKEHYKTATKEACKLLVAAIQRLEVVENKKAAVIYGELQEAIKNAQGEGDQRQGDPQIPAAD